MRATELAGKLFWVALVAAGFAACGVIVLAGQHAGNAAFLDDFLGWALLALGALTLVMGAPAVLWAAATSTRAAARAHELVISPRGGPPVPPPAWGMSAIGRTVDRHQSAAPEQFRHPKGGGSVRVMRLDIRQWDVPVGIGLLLAWTLGALLLLAPR